MNNATLQTLICACSAGTEKATGKLYDALLNIGKSVYWKHFRRQVRYDVAEDLIQERIITLLGLVYKLDCQRNARSYIIKAFKNAFMDELRKSHSIMNIDDFGSCDALEIESGDSADHAINQKEHHQLTNSLLDKLGPLQAMVLKLRIVDGYKTEEVAKILGLSKEQVYSAHCLGKKRLMKLLEKFKGRF